MAETTEQVRALRRSPAKGLAEAMREARSERVQLSETSYAVMTAVRVEPGSAAAGHIEQALGCALPGGPGQVTSARERHVVWLAPDEFLTWCPDGVLDPTGSAQDLAEAVGAEHGQAVDVSSNRTTLEVSGPRAASVLSKGCALDLHPSAWPVGAAYATLLARIPVVVWRIETDTFRVLPRSSFAEHLVIWLLDAMAEFTDPAGEALWR